MNNWHQDKETGQIVSINHESDRYESLKIKQVELKKPKAKKLSKWQKLHNQVYNLTNEE